MTINRAMRELIQLGVVNTSRKNTRKEYKRLEKEKYWSIGKEYLRSPVKNAIWINQEKIDEAYAGDSALEHLTMMNAVEYKVYAIDKRNIDKYISMKYLNKVKIVVRLKFGIMILDYLQMKIIMLILFLYILVL